MENMKKAVAVPYVIALILGVAVIGLVGFWFASTGGKFSSQSQSTYCESEALKYCVQKLVVASPQFPTAQCGSEPTDAKCKELVGSTGGGGPGPVGALNFGDACNSGDDKCDKTKTLKCATWPDPDKCLGDTGFLCSGDNNNCADKTCDAPPGGGATKC